MTKKTQNAILLNIANIDYEYEDYLDNLTWQKLHERGENRNINQTLTWTDPLISEEWFFLGHEATLAGKTIYPSAYFFDVVALDISEAIS